MGNLAACGQTLNKKHGAHHKNMSAILAFKSRLSTGPVSMDLSRAFWVKLNRLHRSGIVRFCVLMYKRCLAPFTSYVSGATEQIADHIIS